MMLAGLAQSSPLVSVFAVDIVSTRLSPSFSTSSEPMPKSRMRAWLSDPIMMFDGLMSPWNRLFWCAIIRPCPTWIAYSAACRIELALLLDERFERLPLGQRPGEVVQPARGADVDERHDRRVREVAERPHLTAGQTDVPHA